MSTRRRRASTHPRSVLDNVEELETFAGGGNEALLNSSEGSANSLSHKCDQLRTHLVHIHELKEYLPMLILNPDQNAVDGLRELFSCGFPLCILWNLLPGKAKIDLPTLHDLHTENARRRSLSLFMIYTQQLDGHPVNVPFSEILEATSPSVLEMIVDVVIHIITLLPPPPSRSGLQPIRRRPLQDAPEAKWDSLVQRLLRSESDFVQKLQSMHKYAKALSDNHIMEPDTLGHIFPTRLFIFHHKFLVLLENTAQFSRAEQRWGEHFLKKKEDLGVIYRLYCVNSTLAEKELRRASDSLNELGVRDFDGLSLCQILPEPLRHLTEYCGIIEALKATAINGPLRLHYNELATALSKMKALLAVIQDAQELAKSDQVVSDLHARIKDWKGHDIDQFGQLLVHDQLSLILSHAEVEHSVFLFEKAILYCNEVPESPTTSRKRMGSFSFMPRALSDSDARKNDKMTLQVQGCVYIREVDDVLAVTSKGSNIENFDRKLLISYNGKHLRFICRTAEQLKKWETEIRGLTASQPVWSSRRIIASRLSQFPLPSTVKVKFYLEGDIYATRVSRDISYDALCDAILSKWAAVASAHTDIDLSDTNPVALTYKDESDLIVSIVSTEDVHTAFGSKGTVNLFASLMR